MSSKGWIPNYALDLAVTERGTLSVAGCDLTQLAKEYGTPLYVYDEGALRRRCQEYYRAFADYSPGALVLYASKAFLPLAMAELVKEEGLGLDVMSGGELYTALQAGMPPERIYFNGNNKSETELSEAVEAGIGGVIVDNFHELAVLDEIAGRLGKVQRVLLRINPGVEAHTHEYIKTGQLDSKFGFPLLEGLAVEATRIALDSENLRLLGFHCHIGSQIFALDSFEVAVETVLDFAARVKAKLGYTWKELNLGGGLGIRYTQDDEPKPVAELVKRITEALVVGCQRYGLPLPKLLVEPGRSIAGEAGLTLYTIGSVKTIPGIRTYVAVDGGMPDNPRVALYQARYNAVIANKATVPPDKVVSVAGKCCESGDILIWDLPLPSPESGDILAVFSTGAYTYSMASNYNRLLRPAVVFCKDGESQLVVKRQTYRDLLRGELSLNRRD